MRKDFFYKVNKHIQYKLLDCIVKNKTIKNEIFLEKEYNILKRKYYKILKSNNYTNSNIDSPQKIIWFCWLQGIEKAPRLIKICYESIINQYSKEYKIIVINENNISDYIELPDYIINARKKKIMCNAHFSDYLREELLYKYGGVWLDSTVYISGPNAPEIFKFNFFVYKHINLDRSDNNVVYTCNWLIVSNRRTEQLYYLHILLNEYWKKEKFVRNYFFFDLFMKMIFEYKPSLLENIPSFSPINAHILQFELDKPFNQMRLNDIFKLSNIHKLNYKINNLDENIWITALEKRNEENKIN